MSSTNLNEEMRKEGVSGKARMRRLNQEDKLRMLAKADLAEGSGKIHEILRLEGITRS